MSGSELSPDSGSADEIVVGARGDSAEEEGEEISDGEASHKKKRRKEASRIEFTVHAEGLSKEELRSNLQALAKTHFHACEANGLDWIRGGIWKRVKKQECERLVMRCAFCSKNHCPFVLEILDFGETGYTIGIGDKPHGDHKTLSCKKGVSPLIEENLTQAQLDADPKKFVQWARSLLQTHSVFPDGLPRDYAGKLKTYRERRIKKVVGAGITGGIPHDRLGAIRQKLSSMTELALAKAGKMTFDSPYVVGGKAIVRNKKKETNAGSKKAAKEAEGNKHSKPQSAKKENAKKKAKKADLADTTTLAFVLSTKNLLANIWRQQARGSEGNLSIDTTYRVSVEGFGLVPIGVTGLGQKWYPVAFGVVSKENAESLAFILRMIKGDIEHLVRSFASAGGSL